MKTTGVFPLAFAFSTCCCSYSVIAMRAPFVELPLLSDDDLSAVQP
jgi:hypothetical protein